MGLIDSIMFSTPGSYLFASSAGQRAPDQINTRLSDVNAIKADGASDGRLAHDKYENNDDASVNNGEQPGTGEPGLATRSLQQLYSAAPTARESLEQTLPQIVTSSAQKLVEGGPKPASLAPLSVCLLSHPPSLTFLSR